MPPRRLQASQAASQPDRDPASRSPPRRSRSARARGRGRGRGASVDLGIQSDADAMEVRQTTQAARQGSVSIAALPAASPTEANGDRILDDEEQSPVNPLQEGMDNTDVIETLSDLFNGASTLLNILVPADPSAASVSQPLKNPARFKRLAQSFKEAQKVYGSSQYIDPSLILWKLGLPRDGSLDDVDGDFSPEAVLHAANLATLVSDFSSMRIDGTDMDIVAQQAASVFPALFVSDYSENHNNVKFGSSCLIDETFSLGLDMRTRYAIDAMIQNEDLPNFDPDEALQKIFNEEGVLATIVENVDDSRSARHIADINNRIALIRTAFKPPNEATGPGKYFDLEALEKLFPWDDFYLSLIRYSRMRLDEITQRIEQQEGLDTITESLQMWVTEEVFNKEPVGPEELDDLLIHNQLAGEPQRASPPAPSALLHAPTNASAGQSSVELDQQAQADLRVGFDDEGAPEPANEYLNTYLASWDAVTRDKNKENQKPPGIGGPRRGARQYSFNSDLENDSEIVRGKRPAVPAAEAGPSKKLVKENIATSDSDQDDPFQQDFRPPPVRARKEPRASRQRFQQAESPVPPEVEQDEVSAQQAIRDVALARSKTASTARRRRHSPQREHRESQTLAEVNAAAQAVSMQARIRGLKRPQKRVPWSEADEERLVDLIGRYGCMWSLLEQKGGFEHDRGQVALKDKARNIKVDFLK